MLYSSFQRLKSIDSRLTPVVLASLSLFLLVIAPLFPEPGSLLPANAQEIDPRQAEADRLLQQGIQQYDTSQFSAALNSLQQALQIYRALTNRLGEGNALGNLGGAYNSLGNYANWGGRVNFSNPCFCTFPQSTLHSSQDQICG
jgi:hypothetical protein